MRVIGMGWAGAITEQYEASQKFFIEQLGLPLHFEGEKHVISHFRLPSGQLLELYGPSNRERRPDKFRWFEGHALGFEVDDLEFARLKLHNRGARFILPIETWEKESWSMFLGPEDKLLQIQTGGRDVPMKRSQLLAISWSGMVMQDFGAAVNFFSNGMQLELIERDDRQTSAQFKLEDGHLFEVLGQKHPWSALIENTTLGFEVADLAEVRASLEEKGVGFVQDLGGRLDGHQFAFFRDLDGYLYALWQPETPAAP